MEDLYLDEKDIEMTLIIMLKNLYDIVARRIASIYDDHRNRAKGYKSYLRIAYEECINHNCRATIPYMLATILVNRSKTNNVE